MCKIHLHTCPACPITHTLLTPCPTFLAHQDHYPHPLDPRWTACHRNPKTGRPLFRIVIQLAPCEHDERCKGVFRSLSEEDLDELEGESLEMVLGQLERGTLDWDRAFDGGGWRYLAGE